MGISVPYLGGGLQNSQSTSRCCTSMGSRLALLMARQFALRRSSSSSSTDLVSPLPFDNVENVVRLENRRCRLPPGNDLLPLVFFDLNAALMAPNSDREFLSGVLIVEFLVFTADSAGIIWKQLLASRTLLLNLIHPNRPYSFLNVM